MFVNIAGIIIGSITVVGGLMAYMALYKGKHPLWAQIIGISVIGLGFLTVYEYYIREAFYVNV